MKKADGHMISDSPVYSLCYALDALRVAFPFCLVATATVEFPVTSSLTPLADEAFVSECNFSEIGHSIMVK